jgi:hypothetical protein
MSRNLELEIKQLRSQIRAYEIFGEIATCKSCGEYYPIGFKCGCGRDNTYSNR